MCIHLFICVTFSLMHRSTFQMRAPNATASQHLICTTRSHASSERASQHKGHQPFHFLAFMALAFIAFFLAGAAGAAAAFMAFIAFAMLAERKKSLVYDTKRLSQKYLEPPM